MVASLELDLDVDIGRKVKAHQRVDGLGGRVDDVDETLVGAHLEVLPAVLVLVRRTDDDEDVLLRRQRHRADNRCTGTRHRVDNLARRTVDDLMVIRLKSDADLLSRHRCSDSLSSYLLLMAGPMDLRPPRSGVSHPLRSTRPCAVRRWSRGSVGNPAGPGAYASLACRPRDFRVRTRHKGWRCRHWPSSRVKQPVHSARPRGPEPNRCLSRPWPEDARGHGMRQMAASGRAAGPEPAGSGPAVCQTVKLSSQE